MEDLDNKNKISLTRPLGDCHSVHVAAGKEQISFIGRIFDSFSLFRRPASREAPSIRVCIHKENANEIRRQLELVKRELENEIEADLLPLITEVLDPLLRDVARIERSVDREPAEIDSGTKFREWTDGAKLWVELLAKNKDKQHLKHEIVKHMVQKSKERIERDVRFVEEYFAQFLSQLELPPAELDKLREEKGRSVAKSLKKLQELAESISAGIPFEQMNEWRHRFDHQRARYFEAALKAVDA